MKQRIIAVLLVLCLFACLLPTVSAEARPMEEFIDYAQFYQDCRSMYMVLEGPYDAVVSNDGGALSIGFVQWHGMNALKLLKMICTAAPAFSRATLGDALYNEVLTKQVVYNDKTGWKSRTLSSSEAARVKTLIGSEVGKQCQEEYAWEWIYDQLVNGWELVIRSEAALLYYCGIDNTFGSGSAAIFIRKVRNYKGFSDGDTFDSLNELHDAVLGCGTSTEQSRIRSYNHIVNKMHLSPDGDPDPVTGFIDLGSLSYDEYYAVAWACTASPQVLYGVDETHLKPRETLDRAMAVTFLWRAKGCPEPTTTTNPFVDVRADAYYYKPILWAVENGITYGTDDTHFSPKQLCSRADILTFLYRAVGSPAVSSQTVPFTDVKSDAYYYKAMLWALQNGIDNGTSATTFSPKADCPRVNIVLFLYRTVTGQALLPH